jgi:hypothetical protein
MSDIALLVVNAVVAIVAWLTGFTFIAFLCGSCALFMLIVVAGAYRGARARTRKAASAS